MVSAFAARSVRWPAAFRVRLAPAAPSFTILQKSANTAWSRQRYVRHRLVIPQASMIRGHARTKGATREIPDAGRRFAYASARWAAAAGGTANAFLSFATLSDG
jgi:hypothetical protein